MPVQIPVKRLMRYCNPFCHTNPWGAKGFNRRSVRKALRDGRLVAEHATEDHDGRVAYLVENPSEDPIEIDVGIPVVGYHRQWLLTDGNHRFAAAIYSGRETISARVSGQMDYAKALFGVDCEESEE